MKILVNGMFIPSIKVCIYTNIRQRRWVNLSSQEPTEVQISKLKLKLFRKNQKCMLVIALNPKILYMRFLTAQLNRTLMNKIINMKDSQKCTKYQEI